MVQCRWQRAVPAASLHLTRGRLRAMVMLGEDEAGGGVVALAGTGDGDEQQQRLPGRKAQQEGPHWVF